jgi:DNA-directed RNA polymerase specialized sigma24 family protein
LALILRALEGERSAVRHLVEELTPTIQAAVVRVLALRRALAHREVRQEVEDMTQSIFLFLFANGGRALLRWDPARGLDLRGYVALLSKRETASILRSGRRSPWKEEATPSDVLDENADAAMGPESTAISREMGAALTDAVRARLSAGGVEMFELLLVEGRRPEDVCALTGKTPDAVYAWKSRLVRLAREVAEELAGGPGTPARQPAHAVC